MVSGLILVALQKFLLRFKAVGKIYFDVSYLPSRTTKHIVYVISFSYHSLLPLIWTDDSCGIKGQNGNSVILCSSAQCEGQT